MKSLPLFDAPAPLTRSRIVPRDYQSEDLEESFRLWDAGHVGTLTRIHTGGGKTLCTCLKFDRWLQRGSNYKCLVISYEKQLVWQFAQEVEDVLGIKPGIEMEKEQLTPGRIPDIVVASRQTLMRHQLATEEQLLVLKEEFGIYDVGLLTMSLAKRLIKGLRTGVEVSVARETIEEHNAHYTVNQDAGAVSRLYKFDFRDNWLVAWDEAHKHSHRLTTVGHIVDWFDKNPNSRRTGMTATPKRFDKVSIGDKMFPAIAIDYPLFSATDRCAVKEGYAVPYKQRFVHVKSVDFKAIKKIAGKSQEKWDKELEKQINTEEVLAELCEPMLDMCGDRQTLVFSPSVDMAKNVASYVNARAKCQCACGKVKWYSRELLNQGQITCECGQQLVEANAKSREMEAYCVHGSIPPSQRKEIYKGHQNEDFMVLSICSLCREGYNDPNIACVTIFRPVSEDASSLAEQMKGRGSRTLRGLIDGMDTAEERLEAIANSKKPDCLIIDLVGVTGLADCASTVQIYAEGEPDEVVDRAERLMLGGVEDVHEAIETAKTEISEERERQRKERLEQERRAQEEANRRATLQAEVEYTTHEMGYKASAPGAASEKQIKFIRALGMEFSNWEPSAKQCSRIINQLKDGMSPEDCAYHNGVKQENWRRAKPSLKQYGYMSHIGATPFDGMLPYEATMIIDVTKTGVNRAKQLINECENHEQLTKVARCIHHSGMGGDQKSAVYDFGRNKRELLDAAEDF